MNKIKTGCQAKWKAILLTIFRATMEKQPNLCTTCCPPLISTHNNQKGALSRKNARMSTAYNTEQRARYDFSSESLEEILESRI